MKKKIIIILIAIIIGIAIGYVTFIIANKSNDLNFEKTLDNLIKEHNEINNIYNNINKKDFYYYDGGTCYLYNKNDYKEVITRIKKLYYYGFYDNGTFQKNKKKLYVCLPENCKPLDIDRENVNIVKEESDRKIIRYETNEFVLINDNGSWKIGAPIHDCEMSEKNKQNIIN